MGTGLLIILREGFEAALVVAIVFAYLQIVAYFGYLLPVGYLFLRDPRPARSPSAPAAEPKAATPPATSGEAAPVGAS
jgi:high-affinity Fe2+/Pb2+ permease